MYQNTDNCIHTKTLEHAYVVCCWSHEASMHEAGELAQRGCKESAAVVAVRACRLPCVRRNFNYSLRLVMLSASLLLLGLHYFACALWLVLRVQVNATKVAAEVLAPC
jgi:hypothetical protein